MSTRSCTSVPTFPSDSSTGRMSSSRWVDQPREPIDQGHHRLDLGRVEGGRPAGAPTAPARSAPARSRRAAAPPRPTRPSAPADDGVGPRGRAADPLDRVVRLRLGAADALDGGVGLRLGGGHRSMAASALAWVAATRVDGRVGPGLGGRRPRRWPPRPGRRRRPRGRAARPPGRGSPPSGRARRPAAARARGPRSTPSRTSVTAREDVGGAGDRRQSHAGHATHPFGGPLFGCGRWATRALCRASGVVTAGLPVSSDRARTGHGRRREGVDTGGGTADAGRHGWPRRLRGVPGGTRRDDRTGEAVTVEQVLARQGSTVGRRRAARRVEEPARLAAAGPAPRRPGRSPAGPRRRRRGRPPAGPPAGSRRRRPARAAGRSAARPVAATPSPSAPSPSAPSVPTPAPPRAPASWEPDSRPSRRSGPIPPLPGLAPPTGSSRMPTDRPRPPDRGPRTSRRRAPAAAGWAGSLMALAAVVGVVLLYHLGLYFYVDQKIDRVDALATDGPEVLAPGSAGRRGELPRRRQRASPARTARRRWRRCWPRSPPTASRAVLVSFPPTALVDTPECRTPDGVAAQPGHRGLRVVPARGRPVLHGARRPAALRPADRPLPRRRPGPAARA